MKFDLLNKIEDIQIEGFINYSEDRFQEFINLYREVNGEESARKAEKRFNWQFKDNPYGDQSLIKLYSYKGNVIAAIGTIPSQMKINQSLEKVYYTCDMMVSRDYQKRGIGIILLKKFIQSFQTSFIYGVKEDLFSMLKRMDFQELGDLVLFYKIYNEERFRKAKGLVSLPKTQVINRRSVARESKAKLEFIQDFDDAFSELFNKLKDNYKYITVRDKAYLSWKYKNHPYHNYKTLISKDSRGGLNGYIIFRDAKTQDCNFGSIAEIVAFPQDEEIIGLLLSGAVDYLEKRGVDYIETAISPEVFKNSLGNMGFVELGIKPGFFFFDKKSRFSSNNEDWFVTKGDSDVDLI